VDLVAQRLEQPLYESAKIAIVVHHQDDLSLM